MKKKREIEILAGYNNDNYVLDVNDEHIVLRISHSGKNDSDIHLCKEGEVLTALQSKLDMVPQVVYYEKFYDILMERFIEGDTLDFLYPLEDMLPKEIALNIAKIMKKVHSIDSSNLPIYSYQNAKGTIDFYRAIKDNIEKTCKKYFRLRPQIYQNFGIAFSDIEKFFLQERRITNRTLNLCHCDIHRKNMIVDRHQKIWLLDWELCMLGDPFYDLAIHFQKMRYSDKIIRMFLCEYYEKKDEKDIEDYYREIKIYQDMEALKYVMTDLIHILRSEKTGKKYQELIRRYQLKLENAYRVLGVKMNISVEMIEDVLERCEEVIDNEIIYY